MEADKITYPGNEEPLVVNAINCCRLELLMSCNVARSRCFAVRGVVDGHVGAVESAAILGQHPVKWYSQRNITTLSLANDESLPSFCTLANYVRSIPIDINITEP